MLADAVAGVMFVTLVIYAVTGGADYGGGVWVLFARGPRQDAQRRLVDDAIGPIWEANHVWLILLIVTMFVTLPTAFAALMTALHIPLLLVLVGIVLRGSAFIFRTYDPHDGPGQNRWLHVFAVASLLTPIFLGVCLGAVSAGRLTVDAQGHAAVDFVSAWWAPFPFLVGLACVVACAYLAAIYLCVEAEGDPALQEDFRRRGLIAGVALGTLSLGTLLVSAPIAPHVADALLESGWSLAFQLAVGAVAVATLVALWRRRYRLARMLVIAQVTLILAGLGLAHYPYVILPNLTFDRALAPDSVVTMFLAVLAVGAPLLFGSMWLMFRIFKTPPDGRPE